MFGAPRLSPRLQFFKPRPFAPVAPRFPSCSFAPRAEFASAALLNMAMRNKGSASAATKFRISPLAAASNSGNAKKRNASNAKGSHGIVFNKQLGQHILINSGLVDTIVQKADVKSTDVVLEIGPGTGNLTAQLLKQAKKVVAVEYDKRMVAELHKRFQDTEYKHKLQIIHGDFMQVQLPYFDLCVANVPYQISSPLTFKLLAHRPMWRCAVLMFQREFAMRMLAKPGSKMFCRLSLNTQLLSKVTHLVKVSRQSFKPPPKVESSVVKLEPRNPPPPINFLEWDGLARLCFSRKNRTLNAIFSNKKVVAMLEKNYKTFCALSGKPVADIPVPQLLLKLLNELEMGGQRASKMNEDDFLLLLAQMNQAGFHFTVGGHAGQQWSGSSAEEDADAAAARAVAAMGEGDVEMGDAEEVEEEEDFAPEE